MSLSCWLNAAEKGYGNCCLLHAVQLFTFAGCRLATFAFLGASGFGQLKVISLERNGVHVDAATAASAFPRPLHHAVNRLFAAAELALRINRPEWEQRFGALGRITFDSTHGFRVAGIDLGPKLEQFRYVVTVQELRPCGDPPAPRAKLDLVVFPRPTIVRVG